MINIRVLNLDRTMIVEKSTSLEEIVTMLDGALGFTPINATVNNTTMPLDATLYEPCDVRFVGIESESASRTYFRTLFMILCKALNDTFPERRLIGEHSVSNGYYVTVTDMDSFTREDLATLKQRADEIIKSDLPIEKKTIQTSEAIALARQDNNQPMVDLLETVGSLYTSVHQLDGYTDSYDGSLMTHTGAVYLYDIIFYLDGLLIRVPDRANPTQLAPMQHQPKMQAVIKEQDRLLATLGLAWVGSVNKAILEGKAARMIQVSEAVQEKQIATIAERIASRYNDGVRIVLISGPSSSGKTTFTNRLYTQLLTCFIRPHMISLDDYFVDRENTPRDEFGEYDFESLYALDLELFNKHMELLLKGETVALPTFDFLTGKRVYLPEKKLKLEAGDVLMLEGIHGLNPQLLPSIDTSQTHKIYVSALTALGLDEHNPISTTTNRLLRRIIRDNSFRGYSAQDTIASWPKVRRGEARWVFPFQEYADDMFNSSMVYEIAAIRPIAEPLLLDVPQNVPQYTEARRLLRFLRYNRSISKSEIPVSSLLREFLGGSLFYE